MPRFFKRALDGLVPYGSLWLIEPRSGISRDKSKDETSSSASLGVSDGASFSYI